LDLSLFSELRYKPPLPRASCRQVLAACKDRAARGIAGSRPGKAALRNGKEAHAKMDETDGPAERAGANVEHGSILAELRHVAAGSDRFRCDAEFGVRGRRAVASGQLQQLAVSSRRVVCVVGVDDRDADAVCRGLDAADADGA